MGYTTDFSGSVEVVPPLNESEREYLSKFAATRRMDRERGPYFVEGTGSFGQGGDKDIRDYNSPPDGQPGLWCQWVPSSDGTVIEWDGGEKFYDAPEWMAYLIDHFLKPRAKAAKSNDPQFARFTFDHVCNGDIEAQGEDYDDRWLLRIRDNAVTVHEGRVTYDGAE